MQADHEPVGWAGPEQGDAMIPLAVSGRHTARILRVVTEVRAWAARLTTVELRVPTKRGELRFRCANALMARRACTLYIKEPGTIAWLDREMRPDDVFLDIGANVGVYTLYAALRLGPAGHVYAIEPHLPTAVALLENVAANGLGERVSVLACALAEEPGPARFDYGSWRAGSSRDQFPPGRSGAKTVKASVPGSAELKLVESVDRLVTDGIIRAPHVVKIDVDGAELPVLSGMRATLTGPDRPRTVQVERTPEDARAIEALLAECGYALRERHASLSGNVRLRKGADILTILHNAVFTTV